MSTIHLCSVCANAFAPFIICDGCFITEEAENRTARVLQEADIEEDKRDVIHREIGKFRMSMKVSYISNVLLYPTLSPTPLHTILHTFTLTTRNIFPLQQWRA